MYPVSRVEVNNVEKDLYVYDNILSKGDAKWKIMTQ